MLSSQYLRAFRYSNDDYALYHVLPVVAAASDAVADNDVLASLLSLRALVDQEFLLLTRLRPSDNSTRNESVPCLSDNQLLDFFSLNSVAMNTHCSTSLAAVGLTVEAQPLPSFSTIDSAGDIDSDSHAHPPELTQSKSHVYTFNQLFDIHHLMQPITRSTARHFLNTYTLNTTTPSAFLLVMTTAFSSHPSTIISRQSKNLIQFLGQRSILSLNHPLPLGNPCMATLMIGNQGYVEASKMLANGLSSNISGFSLETISQEAKHTAVMARYNILRATILNSSDTYTNQIYNNNDDDNDDIDPDHDIHLNTNDLPKTGLRKRFRNISLHESSTNTHLLSAQISVNLSWQLDTVQSLKQFLETNGISNSSIFLNTHTKDLKSSITQQSTNDISNHHFLFSDKEPIMRFPSAEPTTFLSVTTLSGYIDPKSNTGSARLLKELDRLTQWTEILQGNKRWDDLTDNIDNLLSSHNRARKKCRRQTMSDIVENFVNAMKCMVPGRQQGASLIQDTTINNSEDNLNYTTITSTAVGVEDTSQRVDLDFTECLWLFSLNAINLSDLQSALNAIVENLETCELQPLIHRTNTTALGRVARDCLKLTRLPVSSAEHASTKEQVMNEFDYLIESPLDWLTEVGLWKLGRDYTHHLVGSDLLSWNDIASFLDLHLSPVERLRSLRYLHRAYELATLVRAHMPTIAVTALRTLLKQAVDNLRTLAALNEHETVSDTLPQTHDSTGNKMDTTTTHHHHVKDIMHIPLHYEIRLPRFSSETLALVNAVIQQFDPAEITTRFMKPTEERPTSIEKVWMLHMMSTPPPIIPCSPTRINQVTDKLNKSTTIEPQQDSTMETNVSLTRNGYSVWSGTSIGHFL